MASQSKLETLPVEIANHILSHLVFPRSRLPGRTEWQSNVYCHELEQRAAKNAYFLNPIAAPDFDRFAVDIFAWNEVRHPFNVLALTSRRLRELTEKFCQHLVKTCNKFNLPFAHAEKYGPGSVCPDLDIIVYRRLWLQYAPRRCVFCDVMLSLYPHSKGMKPIAACADCYFAQVYTIGEVEAQFHLSRFDLAANEVRGKDKWVLLVDVEALALKLYGTKAFHATQRLNEVCRTCLRANTVGRIAELRARWESQMRTIIPNTNEWIVKPKEAELLGTGPRWFTYLTYRTDLYMYNDEHLDGGYHLRSEPLDSSSSSDSDMTEYEGLA